MHDTYELYLWDGHAALAQKTSKANQYWENLFALTVGIALRYSKVLDSLEPQRVCNLWILILMMCAHRDIAWPRHGSLRASTPSRNHPSLTTMRSRFRVRQPSVDFSRRKDSWTQIWIISTATRWRISTARQQESGLCSTWNCCRCLHLLSVWLSSSPYPEVQLIQVSVSKQISVDLYCGNRIRDTD